jgi:hypothetical protein
VRRITPFTLVGLALVAGCGGSDNPRKPLIAPDRTAVVRGELTPNVHLFGEPILARIDVVLDREKADPDAIEVSTDFKPYETVGETQITREDIGKYTQLRYETALRCLNEDCIPRTASGEITVSQLPGLPPFLPGQQRDEKRKYEFPPAVVTLAAAAEGEDATTLGRVVWPPLRSLSRINWEDSSVVGQGFPFVTSPTPLPEAEYRISPTVLGIALLAGAVALLALPAWLLWDRRRRRAASAKDDKPALSPLERALALVEWASHRPSAEERREALEVLAVELDDADAAKARERGWSPPAPEPEEMAELVTSIRESDAPAT